MGTNHAWAPITHGHQLLMGTNHARAPITHGHQSRMGINHAQAPICRVCRLMANHVTRMV